jgi:hypothetical protein
MEARMEIKNKDGVMIEKSVPESLVSNYEALGWKLVEKKKEKEIKEENKSSQASLNK